MQCRVEEADILQAILLLNEAADGPDNRLLLVNPYREVANRLNDRWKRPASPLVRWAMVTPFLILLLAVGGTALWRGWSQQKTMSSYRLSLFTEAGAALLLFVAIAAPSEFGVRINRLFGLMLCAIACAALFAASDFKPFNQGLTIELAVGIILFVLLELWVLDLLLAAGSLGAQLQAFLIAHNLFGYLPFDLDAEKRRLASGVKEVQPGHEITFEEPPLLLTIPDNELESMAKRLGPDKPDWKEFKRKECQEWLARTGYQVGINSRYDNLIRSICGEHGFQIGPSSQVVTENGPRADDGAASSN